MAEEKKNTVGIVSPLGVEIMTVENISCDGDRLVIQGAMMGAVPLTMFVGPEDVFKMCCLCVKPQLICYLLKLPYILLRKMVKKPIT